MISHPYLPAGRQRGTKSPPSKQYDGTNREKKREMAAEKHNSVIHLLNNNIKVIYLYFANNK